ncbi:MAG: endonuclease/exonuclease/phosphatase family protein, partial [Candidatus Cloacimonetes bacterium]|nr:endonuclease/exonuclease/phosphatase family protein [Candidatus Cloacimonadota bacterium]
MKIGFFLIVFLFTVFLFSEEGKIIISEQLPEIQLDSLTFGTDYTLEIMTWNLQNFPKNENTVLYAAKIINAVNPDVIGFQEIQSDSAFIVLIEKLNEIDPIKKWVGFRANTDSWEMNLAYIYKTGVIENTEIYEIYDSEE